MFTLLGATRRNRRGRQIAGLVTVCIALVMGARTAGAAEFFAIVESTGKKPYASLDLAVDTRSGVGANVEFRAFDPSGTFISEFFVPTNSAGFASTSSFGNLFDLTGGQPMLVQARTSQDTVNSGATLNVRSANGPMILGIPPVEKMGGALLSAGSLFSIAVGSFRSARLLIANVSGAQINVDVFTGTEFPPGTGIYSNPRLPNFGLWRVDLAQSESQSNLVIQASGIVIVQVVIDDGRTFHSFMVPASF